MVALCLCKAGYLIFADPSYSTHPPMAPKNFPLGLRDPMEWYGIWYRRQEGGISENEVLFLMLEKVFLLAQSEHWIQP